MPGAAMDGREQPKNRTVSKADGRTNQDVMLHKLNRQIKDLKLKAKELFETMKKEEIQLEETKGKALEARRVAQEEQLRGKELTKLSRLKHMGFDEDIVKAHLQKESQRLQRLLIKKQTDRNNIDINIGKMEKMNTESEKAIIAAQIQYNNTVVENTKLQVLLDKQELQLYAIESKVNHAKKVKSVEKTNKESFKKCLKNIVREVQQRCEDEELVEAVIRKASRRFAADLGIVSSDGEESNSSGSSDAVSATNNDSI